MARTSKYAGIIGTLPRFQSEEPDYQEQINLRAAALQADPAFKDQASELTRRYIALRAEKDQLNDGLFAINLEIAAVSQLLANKFEAEGIDNIRVDGKLVSVYLEPTTRVADRELFRQWCLRNPDLARRMAIPWQTMNELAKKMLLAGEEPPPGVEVSAITKIQLR